MSYLFNFLVSFIIVFIIWWIKKLIEARLSPLIKIPGRTLYNPIFGNVPVFTSINLHDRWRKHYESYGTVYRIYVFNAIPFIAVTDPSTVRHVLLTNAKNYVRGQFGPVEAFQSVVGKTSLLLLNGDMHKNHRSIISPAFRQGNLKKLLPVMFQCSNRLVDHWNEVLKDKSTMIVDIKKFMSNVTLNIIGLAAFGFDFECIGKKSALADSVQNIVEAQDILNQAVLQMFTTIFPSGTRFLKNSANQYLKGIETTRQFLKHMVNEKIMTIEEWKNSETNFLELVLGSSMGLKTLQLTNEELEDELMTFILAGHETSSLALTYTLYFLCKFPEWQEKCRQEIQKALKNDSLLNWDTLHEFSVVRSVIFEALRLLPPAPIVLRRSVSDDYLKGYYIPAKTNVTVLIAQMQRLPEYWPDPEEFKPERFLNTEQHTFEGYAPFGDGLHKCIGYQLAMTEIIVVLSTMLSKFRFQLDSPNDELEFTLGVTMTPKKSIKVKIAKINDVK